MCIWDDDDIFTVDRLRQQVTRMLARGANCSCVQATFFSCLFRGFKRALGGRQVAFVMGSELRRCKGLPLPFENSFCSSDEWVEKISV